MCLRCADPVSEGFGERLLAMRLAIKGNAVRLGIVAPVDVVVDHEEVAERRRRERDELARWGLALRLRRIIVALALLSIRNVW